MLVEEYATEFIRILQSNKQNTVIAQTAAKSGIFDQKKVPFSEIRSAQLRDLGINFEHCYTKVFSSLQDTYGDYPKMEDGIIYSGCLHNTKGEVLEEFLKA